MEKNDLDRKEVYRLLSDSATYGIVALAITITAYPEDWYDIDSLELFARFQEDFGVEIDPDVENKLMALIVSVTTPYFYHDAQFFESVCRTLVNGDPGLNEIEELTIIEVLWGVYEVSLAGEEIDFSPTIERYMERVIASDVEDMEEMTPEEQQSVYIKDLLVMTIELSDQLKKVGFEPGDLPAIM